MCSGAATAGVVKGSVTAFSLIGFGRGGNACVHDGDVTYVVVGGIAIAAFPWIWVDGDGSTCVYDGAVTHDVVEGIAATYSCTGLDCGALPINNENNPGMKEEACAAASSSWIGLDGAEIAVCDGAATAGVVTGIATELS